MQLLVSLGSSDRHMRNCNLYAVSLESEKKMKCKCETQNKIKWSKPYIKKQQNHQIYILEKVNTALKEKPTENLTDSASPS